MIDLVNDILLGNLERFRDTSSVTIIGVKCQPFGLRVSPIHYRASSVLRCHHLDSKHPSFRPRSETRELVT